MKKKVLGKRKMLLFFMMLLVTSWFGVIACRADVKVPSNMTELKRKLNQCVTDYNNSNYSKGYTYVGSCGVPANTCGAFTRFTFDRVFGHSDSDKAVGEGLVIKKSTNAASANAMLNYLKKNAAPGDQLRIADKHSLILYNITASNQVVIYESNYWGNLNARTKTFSSMSALVNEIIAGTGITYPMEVRIKHSHVNPFTNKDFNNFTTEEDYEGYLDSAAAVGNGKIMLGGWVLDWNDKSKKVDVDVYVGGTLTTTIKANAVRTYAQGYAWYDHSLDGIIISTNKSGRQEIRCKIHGTDQWCKNGTGGPIYVDVVQGPNYEGHLDAASSAGYGKIKLTGWVIDWNDRSKKVDVDVYVGGTFTTTIKANAVRSYAQGYDWYNHSLDGIIISTNKSGRQEIRCKIHGTGQWCKGGTSSADEKIYVNVLQGHDPEAYLDPVRCSRPGEISLTGWAYDEDDMNKKLTVDVYIGGDKGSANAEHKTVVANAERTYAKPHVFWNHSIDGIKLTTSKIGKQTVYAYARNVGGGKDRYMGKQEVTITPSLPQISDVRITSKDENQYTVSCKVTIPNGAGSVSRVQFPSWTEYKPAGAANSQDDIQPNWTSNTAAAGKKNGDIYTFTVKRSDHNNEYGLYHTYIYAYNSLYNYIQWPPLLANFSEAWKGLEIENVMLVMDEPVISNITKKADPEGYTITCDVSDPSGIDHVQFPTWTAKAVGGTDQDDLKKPWETVNDYRGTYDAETGKATFRVKRSEHNNEVGEYITEIYAYDKAGNRTSATKATRVRHTFEADGPEIDIYYRENRRRINARLSITDATGLRDATIDVWHVDKGISEKKTIILPVTDGKLDVRSRVLNSGEDFENRDGLLAFRCTATDLLGNTSVDLQGVLLGDGEHVYPILGKTVYGDKTYYLMGTTDGWEISRDYCYYLGGRLADYGSTLGVESQIAELLSDAGLEKAWVLGMMGMVQESVVDQNGAWNPVTTDTERAAVKAFVLEMPGEEEYTITYDANGGRKTPDAQTKGRDEDLTLSSKRPARMGYTFTGWLDANSQVVYQPGDLYVKNRSMNLTAQWDVNHYMIIFAPGEQGQGEMIQLTKAYSDALFNVPECTYFNDEYEFAGWTVKKESTGEMLAVDVESGENAGWQEADDVLSGDELKPYILKDRGKLLYRLADDGDTMILTAQWEEILNKTYIVSYNGGSTQARQIPMPQTKQKRVDLQLSDMIPTRSGYTFTGWLSDNEGAPMVYQPGDVFAEDRDTLLIAQWRVNTYAYTFDANGGTGEMEDLTGAYGNDYLTMPENGFTRDGYRFTGWKVIWQNQGKIWTKIGSTEVGGFYTEEDIAKSAQRSVYILQPGQLLRYKCKTDGEVFLIQAQWEELKKTITLVYDKNEDGLGGAYALSSYMGGEMEEQEMILPLLSTVAFPLAENEFYSLNESKLVYGGWTIKNASADEWLAYRKDDPAMTPEWVSEEEMEADGSVYKYLILEDQSDAWLMPEEDAVLMVYAYWISPVVCDVFYHYNYPEAAREEYGDYTSGMTCYVGQDVSQTADTNNAVTRVCGYDCIGWFTMPDGGEPVENIPMCNSIDIYAHWAPKTYTFTFIANGGEGVMEDQAVSYADLEEGDIPIRKNAFVNDGYVFNGWNIYYTRTDSAGTLLYVYATTLHYQSGDKYQFNSEKTAPEDMIHSEFEDEAPLPYKYIDAGTPTTLTVAPCWMPVYTFRFDANGGEGQMEDQIIRFDDLQKTQATYINENQFQRSGYFFDNWIIKHEASGLCYDYQADTFTADGASHMYYILPYTATRYPDDLITQGRTFVLIAQWSEDPDADPDGNLLGAASVDDEEDSDASDTLSSDENSDDPDNQEDDGFEDDAQNQNGSGEGQPEEEVDSDGLIVENDSDKVDPLQDNAESNEAGSSDASDDQGSLFVDGDESIPEEGMIVSDED